MMNIKSKISLLFSIGFLGSTLPAKCLIGIVFLYYHLSDGLNLSCVPFTLNIRIHGTACRIIVRRLSDFWVIKDVLVDREYETPLVDPAIIIDLGANIGIATLFFATKYPDAVVYAVEPNPDIFEDLRVNTSRFENVKISCIAIAGKEGELDLFSGRSGAGSSIIRRDDSERQYTVSSMTLDGFFHANNIKQVDVLKFDIEGAETVIFRDFKGFNNVRSYVGEIHYDLNNLTPKEIRRKATGYAVEEKYVRKDRSIIHMNTNKV